MSNDRSVTNSDPYKVSIFEGILTLLSYRDLLWIWSLRNIKVRYKQSILGGLWAILQPLSLMVVFSLIFSVFIKIPTDDTPYPIFAYIALLPWTFFATSISLGVSSLVTNMNLITKIYFPREILPISVVIAGFLDLLLAAIVFVGMLIFYQIPLRLTIVTIPLLLAIQIILTLGILFIVSAANVFYRDIHFVIPLGMTIWMYATPIIYPVSVIPPALRGIYMLNPMASLIEAYRTVTLKGLWPDWGNLAVAAIISISVFVIGYSYFKRVEWEFADVI